MIELNEAIQLKVWGSGGYHAGACLEHKTKQYNETKRKKTYHTQFRLKPVLRVYKQQNINNFRSAGERRERAELVERSRPNRIH